MSKHKITLAAEARAMAGKGAARAIRRSGNVPAVIYGDSKEPVLISLSEKDLTLAMKKKGFHTQLCDLSVGNDKHLVIARDVQLHPVSDRPEHADFLRVSDKTIINVDVPVTIINEKACPGLIKGGVLNIVRHEISVYCKATDIPDEFFADLTDLEIGDSIHIGKLNLPAGVEPELEGDFTIITLVAQTAAKAEDEAPVVAADAAATAAAPAKGAAAAAPAKGAAAAAPAKGAPAADKGAKK